MKSFVVGIFSLAVVLYPPRPLLPDVVVTGRVVVENTGAPVFGARVLVVGSSVMATTAADGTFRIVVPDAAFRDGVAVLRVQALGFRTAEHRVVHGSEPVEVELALSALPLQLDEIVVSVSGAAMRRSLGNSAARGANGVIQLTYPRFNTESYAPITENRFHDAVTTPLSTLSIDVDRASYANVRRFVTQGERPPADAVRIEEMINYFPYDDPAPSGAVPFRVTTQLSRAPWRPAHLLARIGIKGREVALDALPPGNFVFLIDVSGSMYSVEKLPLLKTSLRLLVNELRPVDRVAMVVYAGAAGLVLPPTSGADKGRILNAIDALEAGGSTAGGAGLSLAYAVAQRHFIEGGNNRVILATDGDFNIGPSSDGEMVRLIERYRDSGVFLTALGFGMGNLKDSKLEQIADHGNGNFAYIDTALEARKTLVEEMGGTLLTIAKDVKIQVEFNPARVRAYRLLGYENRLLRAEDFADDSVDAGELGAGHTVTALYEIVPVGAETDVSLPAPTTLRYRTEDVAGAEPEGDELAWVKLRYKEPDGDESRLIEHALAGDVSAPSTDVRFAAAVAGFGMLLRESDFAGDLTLAEVAQLADGARGADRLGYRAEFVRIVRAVDQLGLLASGAR